MVEFRCSFSRTGLGAAQSTGHAPQHHSEDGILAAEVTAQMHKPAGKTWEQATASNRHFHSSNCGAKRGKHSAAHPKESY